MNRCIIRRILNIMKETELAQDIITYFDKFDLYFEIWDVDIIAKSGNIITGVETKTTLNFKVIEQAFRNKSYCHYSYIAVPFAKNRSFQYQICKDYGIGILEATYSEFNGKLCDIRERVKPKLNRMAVTKNLPLTDESKKSIPGASGKAGTTITAFKITVQNMEYYIARHPGCTFKELFNNIDHHYSSFSSARGSIYEWMRRGIIDTIYSSNGKLYLHEPKRN